MDIRSSNAKDLHHLDLSVLSIVRKLKGDRLAPRSNMEYSKATLDPAGKGTYA